MAAMTWISIEERLPKVDERTGESEYVLVYRGQRCLPEVAIYSTGLYCKQGWWMNRLGVHCPLYSGKGDSRHPTFTHWAEIEYPNEE